MITVRPAREDEADAVSAVRKRAFATLRSVYSPRVDVTLPDHAPPASRRGDIVVAVDDGEIVGTVEYQQYDDRLHLLRLAVRPGRQRRGIGTALVRFASDVAAARGLDRLTLCTIRETGNAQFFERLGFSTTAEEVASWCESDRFSVLHELQMERLEPYKARPARPGR